MRSTLPDYKKPEDLIGQDELKVAMDMYRKVLKDIREIVRPSSEQEVTDQQGEQLG